MSLQIVNIKHTWLPFLSLIPKKRQGKQIKMHEAMLNFTFIYVKKYEYYEIKINPKINKLYTMTLQTLYCQV
jgi:hypothetical protein